MKTTLWEWGSSLWEQTPCTDVPKARPQTSCSSSCQVRTWQTEKSNIHRPVHLLSCHRLSDASDFDLLTPSPVMWCHATCIYILWVQQKVADDTQGKTETDSKYVVLKVCESVSVFVCAKILKFSDAQNHSGERKRNMGARKVCECVLWAGTEECGSGSPELTVQLSPWCHGTNWT